ncbi:GerAB/ArcD/ProY family transporter [Paenibacillus taiwanensis]|uniref:GerAB/ArcD/ProY family transporter n=1 Tax=Paenibacillus taiwanensis TaxID=401638 RepID=UPI00048F3389|nr:GerAB/ArcD/ProY family transporter [Paenibacillus taiwanensis]
MSECTVPTRRKIHPAFTMSIVITSQITVGMLAFQKYVYKEAGHDAWFSVIAAGICAHFSVFMIVKTLSRFNFNSLYEIHNQLFGKWGGSIINGVLICYWLAVSTYVLRNYIEVLLIWIFPDVPIWVFGLMFFVLIAYGLAGGLTVISVISFIHLLLVSWLILLLYFPLKTADFHQLTPVIEANISQLFKGMLAMGATIGGYDVLFYTSSHMKEPHRIHRYAHMALFIVNVLYLMIMLVSIGYYSPKQIVNNSWDTLTMLKTVGFSFLERFEYIVIMMWFIIVLANLMITSWVIIQGITRMVKVKRKNVYIGLCLVQLIIIQMLQTGDQLAVLSNLINDVAIFLSFMYPFVLFVMATIILGIRCRRRKEHI